MKKKNLSFLIGFLMVIFGAANVAAHCEIPCGIYDDEMRMNMISEHIVTIEKAMQQIMQLGDRKHTNNNQLTDGL